MNLRSQRGRRARRPLKVVRHGNRPRIEALEERRLLTAIQWSATTSGDWNNPNNWSPAQVPGSSDTVTISQPGVTVTVDSAETAGSLTASGPLIISGATLALEASSTIGAGLTLSGGTLEVDGGTTQLDGGTIGGPGTGGTFAVAQGATLDLTDGNSVSYSGTLAGSGVAGSGAGTIALGSGQLNVASGGATFNFSAGLFQWSGGNITLQNGSTLTNAATGAMTLANAGTVTLNGSGTLVNDGTIVQAGAGGLALSGTAIDNSSGGTYDFQADSGIVAGYGNGTVTSAGTVEKAGGAGTSSISTAFSNSGAIAVQAGTLSLANGVGTSTGGAFTVAAGAVLDLTGGASVEYEGTYIGSGAGTIELAGGSLQVAGATTFDFPAGLFQWTGGVITLLNGSTLTNDGVITISNTSATGNVTLNGGGTLVNDGTVVQAGAGNLALSGTAIDNTSGGTYDFQADSGVVAGYGNGTVTNAGTVEKTGGTSTSTIGVPFSNTGTAEADSGTLAFTSSVSQLSGNVLTGGTWNALNGATLALPSSSTIATNQATVTLQGTGANLTGLQGLSSNAGSLSLLDGAGLITPGALSNTGSLTVGPSSTLTVNGSFTQASTGTLQVQLGGAPASGQFGQLSIAGLASLDGTFQDGLAGGFSPAADASYQVMTFASETGGFATIDSPSFHGGAFLQVQTDPGNVILTTSTAVADLAVTISTLVTAAAQPGQPVTVNYQVEDLGQPTPVSNWVDSVFLTTGTTLDASAVLLGRVTHAGAVATDGTYSATLTAPLPLLLPGTYHVLVEADSRGLVPDGNRDNNLLAAATTLPVLTVAAPGTTPIAVTGTIANAEDLLYQATIPAGGIVRLTASTGTAGAAELLADFGAIPTEADALAQAFAPGQSQQLTLTATQAGTYYIVLVGQPGAGGGGTSFSLTAQQVPFLLNSVSPASVGNTGQVTLTITGGELAATDTFALLGPGGASIPESSVQVQGGTTVYATFDLTGATLGTYDLQATSPTGQVVVLPKAVTVQAGQAPVLTAQVQIPSAQRVGRAVNGDVLYQNTGNVDMPAPLLILTTDSNHLELSTTGAANVSTGPQFLMGISPNGPAGILLPGETVQLPFLEESIAESGDPRPDSDDDGDPSLPPQDVQVQFETADSTDPVDYAGLSQYLGLAQTDPVMQAIETEAGPTWGGLVTLLDQAVTDACCQGSGMISSAAGAFQQLVKQVTFQVDGGVSGQLFLNNGGDPLPGALVMLATADGSQADAAVSMSDGTFKFPQLPAGTYNLTVDGYLLAQPVQVTVPASGPVTGLSVTVTLGGVISGTVTAAGTAGPLGGVAVTAISDQGTSFTTQTASDGTYQFTGLADGTYTVMAGGGRSDTRTSGPESIVHAQGVIGVNFTLDAGATLQGTVINGANGSAVAQATVVALDGNGIAFTGTTDTNGDYTIGNLHPGTYTLTVQATGFSNAAPIPITLGAGATVTEPAISLLAPATVTVALQDPSSNPIAGGDVDLSQGGSDVTATLTDSTGHATLTGISAGTYQVAINAVGFYSASDTIVVAPGQSLDLSYTLQPAGAIQGLVTDGSGNPLANVPVTLLAADGAQQSVSTGSDGSYQFDILNPGSYAVSVGQAPGIDRTGVTLAANQPAQVVNFTLSGAIVSGTVVAADGKTPVPNAVVALAQGNSVLVTAQTDSSGAYEFEGVAHGAYTVETGGATGTASAQTIAVGSSSIAVPALQVGGLQLTGTILDPAGDPVAGASLLLIPASPSDPKLGSTTTTDASGDFTLGSLAAGQYTLTVVADGFPGFVRQVTVSSGAAPVTVQLPGGTTISGTVTDATTGQPVAQATVALFALATQQEVVAVQADGSGAYQIANVAPGTYDLVSADPSGAHVLAEVTDVAVGAAPQTINEQLATTGTLLSGTVVDSHNSPIAGASVEVIDSDGNVLAAVATDFNGVYSLPALPPGTYEIKAVAVGYLPGATQTVTVSGIANLSGPTFTLATAGIDDLEQDYVDQIAANVDAYLANLLPQLNPANQQSPGDIKIPQQLIDEINADIANHTDCSAELAAQTALYGSYKALNTLASQYNSDYQSLSQQERNLLDKYLRDLAFLHDALVRELNDLDNAPWDQFSSQGQVAFIAGQTAYRNTLDAINSMMAASVSNGVLNVGAFGPVMLNQLDSVKRATIGIETYDPFIDVTVLLNSGILADFKPIDTTLSDGNAAANAINKVRNDQSAYLNAIRDFYAKLHALSQAIADCHKSRPPSNPPSPSNPSPGGSGGVDSDPSHDPNAITGPDGFGIPNDVAATQPQPYQIDFQNLPTAAAAADVVTITEQLDPNLDWSTFQLGQMGFGGTTIDVPAGRMSYSTVVDLPAGAPGAGPDGLEVQIQAGIDPQTGLVTWTFTSIDPVTQDLPIPTSEGFLPPDDANGDGEGFVSYTVDPRSGDPTGTVINAQATVVFDTNAPINTAPISNTIDAGPPTSSASPLPSTSPTSFTVSWSGQDDPKGSGVAYYDLFVSDNGGPFLPLLTDTTQTSTTFNGQVGNTYSFDSIAIDNVGNVQATPTAAQATTTVSNQTQQATRLSAISGSGTYGGTATLTATLSAGGTGLANESVAFTFINGTTITLLGTATTGTNGVATLTGVSLAGLGAGTYTGYVGAGFTGDSTYGGSSGTGNVTITRAALTVTAANQSMTYGGTVPALAYTYTGLVNGDSGATFTGALATSATSSSGVGSYAITEGTLAATENYTIGTFKGATLTVNPASLSVTAASESMTYGGAVPALTLTYTGLVNGDSGASFTGAVATTATSSSPVGGYAITEGSLAAVGDYTIGTYTPGRLTITPAPLTITANNQSMTYGGPLPTLTASYSGFVNGDTAASLMTPPTLSTTATASSRVATYPVTASGAVAPDYTITYASGTLTITPAPLAVTDNQTDLYGNALALTPTYTGFVLGQNLSTAGITGAPTLSTTATADVGTYPITVGVGTLGAANYSFTAVNGTLTVAPQAAVSATYTGLLYVATASATTSTATVTLSATIKDTSGGAGAITSANVTFVIRGANGSPDTPIASDLPVSLISSTDPTTGTASYNWSVDIGTNNSESFTIGIIVGHDYARNSTSDDAIVTVSEPQAGTATGGGYLVNQSSSGAVPGDAGAHTNFGFNVRNSSSGLRGQANIIVRSQGHVYQFNATSMTSLTFPSGNTADVEATGTIQDITNSSSPVTLSTGTSLQVTMTDNGSGASDTIGITIRTPAGALWFSSAWNGIQTVEQSLGNGNGGGNLQVRAAQELAGAPASGAGAVAPLALDEIGPIAAAAIARWAAAGVDPRQLSVLSQATFQIDDLGGTDLAWERQGVITLDRTADGYGWFLDPTPGDDSAFAPGAGNGPAVGHIDLLSVVAHEMGHLLGYGEDDSAGVTGEYLAPGARHVPIAIRAAGEAPGPLSAASTPVGSRTSVLLGTTTEDAPLIALDAASAGWSSSHHESAPQQVPAPMTASSVWPRDGTTSIVPAVQGWPRRLVLDSGSVDAVIESGSITSLLVGDLAGRPARRGKSAAFRIPS